ncbi:MAG: DUF502 domain-containing protein [Nitrospina sp.]|nr:DUF502 domain-containing protein [Nitrospina sp.]MBT3508684.1 DUF502 domain-containing protein [Nitrospina sp.]MBT3874979.1 DUF502 domain-containing protein [Nitrospina sp.]MBT4048038.1 DUF502 domain-containing protein [Nitrospina sp.]MBT4556373.1 DUF502 domain-containing protein [Nitrospina sp.]
MITKLQRRIRNIFITGLLITLPIALTWFILQFLLKNFDALSPVFTNMLIQVGVPIPEGYRIPFLGLGMTLLIVLMVGWFTTNFFGKKLFILGETIVEKIPFVRRIYKGTKQVVLSIAEADTTAFRKVVLLEFPRRGLLAIGFVTGESRGEVQQVTQENMLNVFVPTMPNPTSGFLIFSPPEELTEVSMTIEEGIKYVVSGGIVTPPSLKIIEAKGLKLEQPS